MNERRFPVLALAVCACLGLAGCSGDPSPVTADEDWEIDFGRSSSFAGGDLSVFLVLEDVQFRSIHPLIDVSAGGSFNLADVIAERPFETPLPGHEGKALTFLKIHESGTSVAHGALSWDPEHPEDYLMAGWRADFPGQHPPVLSLADSEQYAIFDGPEIGPLSRPQFPAGGRASYVGPAGGLYAYEARARVIDEYEGVVNLQVDFADRTIAGCIGCLGDLMTRRVHFGDLLGENVIDTESLVLNHEIHLGALEFDEPGGRFEGTGATVVHPDLEIVDTGGRWGGQLSGRPDTAGWPRLVVGTTATSFSDENGVDGAFSGTFVALSPDLRGE